MRNPEIQSKLATRRLASVVTVYPKAFAMAAFSESRTGLALRHFAVTELTRQSVAWPGLGKQFQLTW